MNFRERGWTHAHERSFCGQREAFVVLATSTGGWVSASVPKDEDDKNPSRTGEELPQLSHCP